MRTRLFTGMVFVLSVLAALPAQAELVSYSFISTITGVGDPYDRFDFEVGDKVIAGFTVDTSYPDANPTPGGGSYGVMTGRTDPSALVAFYVDGSNAGWGRYQEFVTGPRGLFFEAAGPQAPYLRFEFRSSENIFVDERLGQPIDPALFDLAEFDLHVTFSSFYVTGTFDAIAPVTTVPEPGSVALLGAALFGFTFWSRRRMR
jgi:hypothetical protein